MKHTFSRKDLGSRIRYARDFLSMREQRLVSQGELARRLNPVLRDMGVRAGEIGLDQGQISRIERGHLLPNVAQIAAWEVVTGLPAAFIAFNVGREVLLKLERTLPRRAP